MTYYFRDSTYEDKSIVKKEYAFTPKTSENQELEAICKILSETKINIKSISDNIPNLGDELNSLMTKIRSNEITINPVDKGSIVVMLFEYYYWKMCQSHWNNEQCYRCLFETDPSLIVDEKIIYYANQYPSISTNNEYEYLINITKNVQTEGQPIVAGAVCYTSGISKMLHLMLEPSLSFIPHILKDSFDFLERLDTTCTEDTLLSSCDIKSLYTNICHDVFYKAIDYWIEKLINDISLRRRFTKSFYFRRTFNNFRI